jgi:hypothetical protein
MPQISVPIIDVLLHPPLGLLQRELITGLISGPTDLTRNTGNLAPFDNVNAYGLTWSFFTVPAEFGLTLGSPIVYEERMVQVSTVHTDFAGHDIISEYHGFSVEGIYWMWENPGPTRVHVEVAPGLSIQAYWLVVHP